jgi:hypothetical protein
MPLRRTLTLANLNDENQPEKANLLLSLSPAADPSDVIEKDQCKEGVIGSLAISRPPFTVLVQPYTMVRPSTSISLRQSSPLGPCQYLLPGRPVFPRSICEPDLYRQALKMSARQAKRRVRRMEGKKFGGSTFHRKNTLV